VAKVTLNAYAAHSATSKEI